MPFLPALLYNRDQYFMTLFGIHPVEHSVKLKSKKARMLQKNEARQSVQKHLFFLLQGEKNSVMGNFSRTWETFISSQLGLLFSSPSIGKLIIYVLNEPVRILLIGDPFISFLVNTTMLSTLAIVPKMHMTRLR